MSELKLTKITGEKLCEIEAAAKRFASNVKQTPSDKRQKVFEGQHSSDSAVFFLGGGGVGFLCKEKEDI